MLLLVVLLAAFEARAAIYQIAVGGAHPGSTIVSGNTCTDVGPALVAMYDIIDTKTGNKHYVSGCTAATDGTAATVTVTEVAASNGSVTNY
jgi:hypothetical protein